MKKLVVENIKDFLKPKMEEEINKNLENLSLEEKYYLWLKNDKLFGVYNK